MSLLKTSARAGSALLLFAQVNANSVALDGVQIVTESDRRIKANDEVAEYEMELLDDNTVTHVRKLKRFFKKLPDKQSTVIQFTEPLSVKRVSLLIEDKGIAINDIWSYTPATKTLRRIAGSQKQNWFMGTEFSYEDFEDYKLNAYHFTLVQQVTPCLSWERCYVIDAVPSSDLEARTSGYSRKRYLIETETFYPVSVEYFDSKGVLTKVLKTEGLTQQGNQYRATVQQMENKTNRRQTRMKLSSIKLNSGIQDSVFSPRFLRSEQ